MTTTTLATPPVPISYPARPTNGGPFDKARPKLGRWLVEPKYNGWRSIVHVPTGTMWNRHGAPLSIGSEFDAAINEARRRTDCEWLDVEALERRHGIGKGCLIVLDVIDDAANQYQIRRVALEDLATELDLTPPKDFPLLSIPPLIAAAEYTWRDLQAINKRLGCEFYEGIVMKKADSLYPVQRRSPNEETRAWVKHRWQW